LYPNATTVTAGPDNEPDFTTLEQQEVSLDSEYSELEAESSIEIARGGSETGQATASDPEILPPSTTSSTSSRGNTVTITTRRYNYPFFMPLLTMLRYCSTIWLSDLVNTSFSTSSIHHSAVSIYSL